MNVYFNRKKVTLHFNGKTVKAHLNEPGKNIKKQEEQYA